MAQDLLNFIQRPVIIHQETGELMPQIMQA